MTPVSEVLTSQSTLKDAIQLMKKTKWNTIPIQSESGSLDGVFTRSCLFEMILHNVPLSTKITEYIKKEVIVLPMNLSYDQLRILVKKSKVGTAVVIDSDGKVVGLMTKADFVLTLLSTSESLKHQLSTVINNTNFGIIMTDDCGKITFVNETCCKMLQKKENEIINTSVQRLLSISSTKINQTVPLQINNETIIVRTSRFLTHTKTYGTMYMLQFETEVEKLAEELQAVKNLKSILDTAVNNAFDGIVMVNSIGGITFFNDPIIELFNLKKDDLKECHIDEVLPHFQLTEVLSTGVPDVSDVMERKGIRYIVRKIPIYQDGKIIGAIGIVSFRQLSEVFQLAHKKSTLTNDRRNVLFSTDLLKTNNKKMEKLFKSTRRAAKGKSTILIRGESGTGKEILAKAIHYFSPRKENPFVTINCAAIPESLLESEFFGYEKGAFSGAKPTGQKGKFELANGGTLFLDEVGDMSLPLQAKLLRVLQEKEFYRVGGTEPISVDVRIVAATHKSLEEMVKSGQFREDLYYRLHVISFELPPLRDRIEDIPLLVERFLTELNQQNGTSIMKVSDAAMAILQKHHWPGNIRELRNVLEHGMVFADQAELTLKDLPEYFHKKQQNTIASPPISLMEQVEKDAIIQALTETKGNKVKAAKRLGMSRSVLYKKIDKYELNLQSD